MGVLAEDEPNVPFSMEELSKAKTGKTEPGKDELCYIMLRHLSMEGLKELLSWNEAIFIPARKLGTDASKPTNYRRIALTSHVCKLMEQRVNEGLMYFLEERGMMATYQRGFRRGRALRTQCCVCKMK